MLDTDGILSSSNNSADEELEKMRLPIKNAQVSWRLNNDSTKNEDLEYELKSKEQVIVSENNSNEAMFQPTVRAVPARVRPGIDKILPKQLMLELMESQGRR